MNIVFILSFTTGAAARPLHHRRGGASESRSIQATVLGRTRGWTSGEWLVMSPARPEGQHPSVGLGKLAIRLNVNQAIVSVAEFHCGDEVDE